jgi:hypothetical protein
MAELTTTVSRAFPPSVKTLELPPESVPSPTATPMLMPRSDRRNVTGRYALLQEMPGSSLTLAQAARLFSLPQEACQRILSVLIEEGAMSLRKDGHYVRCAPSNP